MYILVYTWTNFVCTVPGLSSMFRTQMALEEELLTCKPTVFQGNGMMILLKAVRVWLNNYYVVLCLKQSISAYMLV